MQFSLSKAWNDAVAMISANREVVLIIAGIFFFLPSFLSSFVMGGTYDMAALMDPARQEEMAEMVAQFWWLSLLTIIGTFVGTFSLLALLRSADKPTVGEAIKASLRCSLSALAIYLIFVLLVSIIFAIFIGISAAIGNTILGALLTTLAVVTVVYLTVRLSLVPPVLAIEKMLNPITAIKRSLELTKGHSGRLLAFYVLLTLGYLIIAVPFVLLLGGLTLILGDTAGLLISGIIGAALSAVISAVFVAIQAAIHDQLARADKGTGAGFQFD